MPLYLHTQIKMFRFVVLACLLVAIEGRTVFSISHPKNIIPTGKIVGGSQATIQEVPHQVALEDAGFQFCAGSIISSNFILTAAQCTEGRQPSDITVRYGTSKLESSGSVAKVAAIAQNPGFNTQQLDSDVSILKLARPISLSDSAQPITLRNAEAVAGETGTVSGWGTRSEIGSNLATDLQKVNVPIVSRDKCNAAYNGLVRVTERMICAGETGKDSCVGDSGSAIAVGGKQVGIVSWGYGCAEPGYPGVYANAAALKSYIDENSNYEANWA